MQQKILEIIELLIAEIDQVKEPLIPDINILSKKLIERGYTEHDIQKAVEWIFEFINRGIPEEFDKPFTGEIVRILSPFEKRMFSIKAQGYLMQLQSLGLVKPLEFELIIDRCLMLGMDLIDLEDVKAMTVNTMLGKETGISTSGSTFHPGNETVH